MRKLTASRTSAGAKARRLRESVEEGSMARVRSILRCGGVICNGGCQTLFALPQLKLARLSAQRGHKPPLFHVGHAPTFRRPRLGQPPRREEMSVYAIMFRFGKLRDCSTLFAPPPLWYRPGSSACPYQWLVALDLACRFGCGQTPSPKERLPAQM